jgi:hypothetical protein
LKGVPLWREGKLLELLSRPQALEGFAVGVHVHEELTAGIKDKYPTRT